MADRSHLTPARVTDKNGRPTTVYRNEAAGPAAAGKTTVPAPASPARPRGPKPLPTAEVEQLAADLGVVPTIRNKDLDELLRERPHDIDRIIQYKDERGIHSFDSPEDVEALRQWLDSTKDAPSLGRGCL